ncbi:MAG: phosphatidate cytidylyltransferase [Chloroflexi bacterium]|nr:phosphatidate cytidylyltransferase [Chloroflexota bacterium]
MLRERVTSALMLGALAFAAVGAGQVTAAAFIVCFIAICLVEYAVLLRSLGTDTVVMLVWGLALSVQHLLPATFPDAQVFSGLLVVSVVWTVWRFEHGCDKAFAGFSLMLIGALLIGWMGGHFLLLRLLPQGFFWMVTVVLAVAFADSAAYFIGRKLGKHPMAARTSPHKTWEGYSAGIAAASLGTAAAAALWQLTGTTVPHAACHALIIGFLVAAIAPISDLFFSVVKRSVGAKHASNLIPGHGGLLDRFDTLLLASAIGYYYVTLVVL